MRIKEADDFDNSKKTVSKKELKTISMYCLWMFLIPLTDFFLLIFAFVHLYIYINTGCFLRPDIKRFCLIFTIGPHRIWFCLIQVPDFFLQ